MLSAADEKGLKSLVNNSVLDDTVKTVLIQLISALAKKAPAAADQTAGFTGTFSATSTETITIKDGIITGKS